MVAERLKANKEATERRKPEQKQKTKTQTAKGKH
jgi:hypothetical protein